MDLAPKSPVQVPHSVVLVTGAGSGIGRCAAIELARRGAEVVAVFRTPEQSVADAATLSSVSGGCVHGVWADLSSQHDVRRLATEVRQRWKNLSALLNVAGIQRWDREQTPEGVELTWATNVLAPYLLTRLLMDHLEQAVVVNVSSVVHRWGRFDWEDLEAHEKYDANQVYYQSKLALTALTVEFARRFTGTKFFAFEPGMTRTNFARDFRGFYRFMVSLCWPFLRSPATVGNELVDLAVGTYPTMPSGAYVARGRSKAPSNTALDPLIGDRLWITCERMTAACAISLP